MMSPKDLYENCRTWLQFAETKNGFALAFCGAIIAAQVSLIAIIDNVFRPYLVASMALIILSAVLSLLSFIPRLSALNDPLPAATGPTDIVYFAEIARYDRASYVAQAQALLQIATTDRLAAELLGQCYSLSVITVRKLNLFYASVVIAGVAFVVPAIAALVTWCRG